MGYEEALEALSVRVIVATVGPIDEDQWTGYCEILRKLAYVQCAPSSPAATASVFTKQVYSATRIRLQFIQSEGASDDMRDFEDFQLYRKPWAVLGLGVSREFTRNSYERFTQEHKTFAVQRCFVVGEAHPPGEGQEGRVSFVPEDPDKQEESFKVLLSEMASAILRAFEFTLVEYSKLTIIASPRQLDAKLGKDQANRLRQRSAGRLAKLTGDLYLLAGAYSDAVSTLVTATEECKIHGDMAWHAASQEALQIALVLQSEATLQDRGETTGDLLWLGLPEKLREIAPLYHRADLHILAFELYRAISALLNYGRNLAEAAMALCQGWAVHRQLAFADKLYVLTVIINRFEALGMRRKRAFFLQALSALLAHHKESSIALRILRKTFPAYRINLDESHCDALGCWEALRLAVLKKAAKLSESHHDRRLSVAYHSALLGMGRMALDNEDQVEISKVLKQKFRRERLPDQLNSLCCPLPLLCHIVLDKGSPEFWRPKAAGNSNGMNLTDPSGPFIYNPFAGRNSGKPDGFERVAVAINQTVPVRLVFSNPFAFSIDIVDCTLDQEGVDGFSCESVSTTLPPWTKSKMVSILCTPRSLGIVKIDSLSLTIFGTRMKISPHGNGEGVEFDVISEQPILKLTVLSSTADAICLVDRQIRAEPICLRLYNLGKVPVKTVALQLWNEWDREHVEPATVDQILFSAPPSKREPVRCSNKPLSPIRGDEYVDVKLELTGVMGWKSTKLIVEYESVVDEETKQPAAPAYRRSCEFVLRGTVLEGVRVERITALRRYEPHKDGDEECLVALDCRNQLAEADVEIFRLDTAEQNKALRVGKLAEGRLVVPFRRLTLEPSQLQQAIPMEGQQMAALRKLSACSADVVQSMDKDRYWVKRQLVDTLKLGWRTEDGRTGLVSLIDAKITTSSLNSLCREGLKINVNLEDGAHSWPIHSKFSVHISVSVSAADGGAGERYAIRAFPALYMTEEELGVEIEDLIIFEGSLQCVGTGSVINHQFSLLAIVPCRARLLVHVQRMSDGRMSCHADPVIISFY